MRSMATKRSPFTVLLDLNMPVKNGWDIFERLNSINPLLPIIITGRPDRSALAEAAGVAALMETACNPDAP
jgi:CheY-like chemotaxis protein